MGDFKWGDKCKITKVSYENGVESFKFGNDTGNNLWLSQENMYIVKEEQVKAIYNQLKDFTAYSFEGKTIIDPALDVGDKIIIDGKPIIYQGEADFQTRFVAEINSKIATKQKQETTTKKQSQTVINRRVQSRIDETEGKITQLVEEQTDFSHKLTKTTQNVDSITDEINRIYDFEKEVEGTNEIILEDCLPTTIIELRIKPTKIKGDVLYPSNDLYPSQDLFPNRANDGVTIVFAGRSRVVENDSIYPSQTTYPSNDLYPIGDSSTKKFQFYFGEPLRIFNDVSDELRIIFNEETGICEAKVIRRIDYNNGVYTIYEIPKEEHLGEKTIELFEGKNYIYLSEYTDWSIYAKYIFNNNLNKEYALRVETNSSIRRTADEINLKVRKKVNQDEVISSINLSPEEIKIQSKNISLEGYTTINKGFSIDENGNASISNGAVKINEKGIEMADGTRIVGGEGMLTQFQYSASGKVGYVSSTQWVERVAVYIPIYIPDNFIIVDAVLYGQHTPCFVWNYSNGAEKMNCYARNIKLYKTNNKQEPDTSNGILTDLAPDVEEEIVSDFGKSSGKTFSSSSPESFTVKNIKDFLSKGMQYLYFADYKNNPDIKDNFEAYQKSGIIDANLFVTGYIKS